MRSEEEEDDEQSVEVEAYVDLLTEFGDSDDLDDEESRDIDAGVDLDDLAEADGDDDEHLPLDSESLLDAGTAESFAGEDDLGPALFDLGDELDELPHVEEDEQRAPDDIGGLLDELPPLGEDEDTEGAEDPVQLLDLEEDQSTVPREPWPSLRLNLPTGPRHMVEALSDGVLIGGAALERWCRDGTREELLHLRATIRCCVPCSEGYVLSTVTGDVLRLVDGLVTPLEGWRRAAQLASDSAVEVRLAGTAERLLLLTSAGAVLASRDAGETWDRLAVGGKVLSINSEPPLWMVVEEERGAVLVREHADDAVACEPTAHVRSMFRPGCLLVARDPAIAIAARGHGVALSTDGGRTFAHLPGLSTVTALAAGTLPDGPQLFVATFSAAGNSASLHRVDVRTRNVTLVGDVRASDDDDDAAVVALAFDDAERSLWAVGSFGVRVFGRPD